MPDESEIVSDEAHRDALATRFESARPMLRGVAFRMLGSGSEADDAVQEAWLRLTRTNADDIGNLEGWLTTTVARVCLDMLRTRRRAIRREQPLGDHEEAFRKASGNSAAHASGADLEHDMQVADAVGLALLVVLDRLAPAERVAFVLHDAFDLPFEEIGDIVGRTPAAARQLASRARRRVRATPLRKAAALRGASIDEQRSTVDAYLAASRAGDIAALIAVLDPDVVLYADPADVARGAPAEVHGASAVAGMALAYGKRAPFSRAALVDGAIGAIVAPQGRLVAALRLLVRDGRVAVIDVVTDGARLDRLEIAVVEA
jgi:RNA polymerase sigma-70 factor (ECF subfamily)